MFRGWSGSAWEEGTIMFENLAFSGILLSSEGLTSVVSRGGKESAKFRLQNTIWDS